MHAKELATGKSLLGRLDKIEVEIKAYLWCMIVSERATLTTRDWLWLLHRGIPLCSFCKEAMGEKWTNINESLRLAD